MNRLKPELLHVRFAPGTGPEGPILPRCYTQTHSDRTGDMYLTIGCTHDLEQIAGWYTRFMRDETLAAWQVARPQRVAHRKPGQQHSTFSF